MRKSFIDPACVLRIEAKIVRGLKRAKRRNKIERATFLRARLSVLRAIQQRDRQRTQDENDRPVLSSKRHT